MLLGVVTYRVEYLPSMCGVLGSTTIWEKEDEGEQKEEGRRRKDWIPPLHHYSSHVWLWDPGAGSRGKLSLLVWHGLSNLLSSRLSRPIPQMKKKYHKSRFYSKQHTGTSPRSFYEISWKYLSYFLFMRSVIFRQHRSSSSCHTQGKKILKSIALTWKLRIRKIVCTHACHHTLIIKIGNKA